MRERERLVKIVRTEVPQFLGSSEVHYRPVELTEAERHELLIKKLGEEVLEYALNPSMGELADVLDCIKDLAWVGHSGGLADVMREAQAKTEERGGFVDVHGRVMGMFVTTTAPPRHEGEHAKATGEVYSRGKRVA